MKLILKSVLVLTLMIFSISSQGENCKRVNLLYKKWGMFPRQMPLYDQGANMMCYSYTAVQLSDYWRETHFLRLKKIKLQQSTPLYGALLSRILIPRFASNETLDLGSVSIVLAAIRTYGMCQEQVIARAIEKFTVDKNITQNEFLFEVERFFALHSGESVSLAGKLWTPFEKIRNWNYPPKIDQKKLKWAMSPYLKKKNFVGFLKNVFGECFYKKNLILNSKKVPVSQRLLHKNKTIFYQTLLKLLDHKDKPQPVGIGYCANVLQNKRYRALTFSGEVPNSMKEDCWGHSSIIVGKRTRSNRCQLLLRNTWGTDCNYDWECLRDKEGKVVGVWIDAEALMENSDRLYFISDTLELGDRADFNLKK